MEDKTLCKGLSITAIVLIAISAILLSFNSANGILYGDEATFYGIPFIAAFAIPLLVILIVLSHYINNTDTVENMIAAVAVRYAIFGWFFVFFFKFCVILMEIFFKDFFYEHFSAIYLIMNSINVSVIGTLVLSIALRKLPAVKIEKRKMKIRQLLFLIMIMYGITQVGSIMGLPIHTALSAFSVQDESEIGTELANMLFSSNMVIRIITVGIMPAIFEELLFRKFLIDRTIRHGEFISCAMSGIMFGLWHGNFQQFFFAFFIGVLFAFVYIRTGNIIYTMIMHASMNLVTATVTLQLLVGLIEKMGIDLNDGTFDPNINYDELLKNVLPILLLMMIWIILLAGFQITGFIFAIIKRKNFKLVAMEGEPGRKVLLHKLTHSVEMWVFFSLAILLFVYSYMPDIIAFIYK
ncbi:MAG: CPBP family intramembrane metalloprotease [Saccharofermentans sp.]|nr:CPBP family intramembrane metalloprotease [Saccharofermentans sp.]